MVEKLKANIYNFLSYASELYPQGLDELPSIEVVLRMRISFEGLNTLNEDLATLDWNTPLYDDTLPDYTLKFKAVKTIERPLGVFNINHKSTGDYINSGSDSFQNGAISDYITVSYGIIDKSILTVSNSIRTNIDKNKEIISSQLTSEYNQSITSSNNSVNDKTDDYIHTTSYKYLHGSKVKTYSNFGIKSGPYLFFNETTDPYSTSYNFSDTYISKYLNYTNSFIYSTDSGLYNGLASSGNYLKSLKSQFKFSNKDIDSGTSVTANINYTENHNHNYFNNYDKFLVNVSSAKFKIISKNETSTLDFSVEVVLNNSDSSETGAKFTFKNFTLENTSLKMISGEFSISQQSMSSDSLAKLIYILTPVVGGDSRFSISETLISGAMSTFNVLNQGNDTITIKGFKGIEIDAGNGKDVVVGGVGDDTIIGGSGSDKLTGGKGLDKYFFSVDDFYSYDSNYDLVFDKSVDIITDFSIKDGDILDFDMMFSGKLNFYNSLNEAITDKADLFYVKGKIYYNTSLSSDYYTPAMIVSLTGSPPINAALTDFDYHA
jgi:hypothetical protein